MAETYHGRPCKKGHGTEKYTSDRGCVICALNRAAKRHAENPQRHREDALNYYYNNKDYVIKRVVEYQKQNPEVHRKACRVYKKRNPDKNTADTIKRHAAKLKRTPMWANLNDIQIFYTEAQRLTKETGIKYHVDHVVPLQGEFVSGLHVQNNLQVILAVDNLKKHNRVTQD